ncbi:MAG TPA: hypothetical protein VIV06_09710 [Candidatus Limnocylindrales bacterium]
MQQDMTFRMVQSHQAELQAAMRRERLFKERTFDVPVQPVGSVRRHTRLLIAVAGAAAGIVAMAGSVLAAIR